jgi:hypothetical protein
MPLTIARLTLSQSRDGEGAATEASLEVGGGGGIPGVRGMVPQAATPSSTHGGGSTPSRHDHHTHAPYHHHHPLASRPTPAPRHHHHAPAHIKHKTEVKSPDVSPYAFANGLGATMPAPSSRSPLDRPHLEHHREPSHLYPSQQGALNVRNQTANANLAKERHAAAVAEAHHPASTPSAPSKGTPTRDDPRGLRDYIREQAGCQP